MECVPGMHLDQSKEVLVGLQCVHSKVAASLFPNWDDHWTIDEIEDTDLSYQVFCNRDISIQTFLEEGRFLAAIQVDGDVTLLFTVGSKQKFPLCSRINCSKQTKCICYRKYKRILDGEGHEDEDRPSYYWEKRTREKPACVEHFLEDLPIQEHHRHHGYNRSSLEYPIKICPQLQQKFLKRLEGSYDLPDKIVPPADSHSTCTHDECYAQDDDQLKMMSPNLTIYTENSDKILPIPTYGRPTCGDCKCFDQADTHELLLWNLGKGFINNYWWVGWSPMGKF